MSYSLIASIVKGKWLIDPSAAKNYLPLIANVLKGTTQFEEKKPELVLEVYTQHVGVIGGGGAATAAAIAAVKTVMVSDQWDLNHKLISPNSTVVVPVSGPMMKNDQFCGPVGMMHLASITNQLSEHPNVDAIIFDIDSPGGQVDGTQTFAEAIKNSSKKTIAFVNDGMACSAAYWIGSSCDEFYVSKRTDVVGSIGVYCTLADFKSWYEAEGLKIHEIYSRKSSEKNKDYKDAMKGEYDAVMDDLDFLATEFINAVKENRPGINLSAGDPFKGATYYAEQAIEIGLIDGIKSMSEVLSIAQASSQSNTEAEASETQSTDNNQDMIKELTAVKGKAAADITPEEINAITAALHADEITGVEVVPAGTVEALTESANLAKADRDELVQLREWKESAGSHTTGKAKIDTFNENAEEETPEAILAREQSILAKDHGLDFD